MEMKGLQAMHVSAINANTRGDISKTVSRDYWLRPWNNRFGKLTNYFLHLKIDCLRVPVLREIHPYWGCKIRVPLNLIPIFNGEAERSHRYLLRIRIRLKWSRYSIWSGPGSPRLIWAYRLYISGIYQVKIMLFNLQYCGTFLQRTAKSAL
jgi:hypothetical protein